MTTAEATRGAQTMKIAMAMTMMTSMTVALIGRALDAR